MSKIKRRKWRGSSLVCSGLLTLLSVACLTIQCRSMHLVIYPQAAKQCLICVMEWELYLVHEVVVLDYQLLKKQMTSVQVGQTYFSRTVSNRKWCFQVLYEQLEKQIELFGPFFYSQHFVLYFWNCGFKKQKILCCGKTSLVKM